MDFTNKVLGELFTTLLGCGYSFTTVRDYASGKISSCEKVVVLRHDVDKKPEKALKCARSEAELGIRGTYYFRVAGGGFDSDIIRAVSGLGHEAGYHYEDMSRVTIRSKRPAWKHNPATPQIREELAMTSFSHNIGELRKIVHVDTACMHGSPLSRHDSRDIWKYHDYLEYGIICEPYFDIVLDEMLYLTDTGRRWDGSVFSVRDRVGQREEGYYDSWRRRPARGSALAMTTAGMELQRQNSYRNTFEIIRSLKQNKFPDKVLMTIHPQRWSDNYSEWLIEKLAQGVKNQLKFLLGKLRSGSGRMIC